MFERWKKRRHFKKRIRAVTEAIWDLEFQREKLKMLREDVRIEYDRLNETSEMAKRKIDEEKKNDKPDKQTIKNLEAVVEKYAPDLKQKKDQMEGLDNEISGEANPQSSDARIEGFRSLRTMYREYLKKI